MKIRRFLAVMIIAVITCTALAACGKTELETSVFSVTAPSGWGVIKRTIDGSEKDDQVYVIKDGEIQTDTLSHPNVLVSYYKNASDYALTKSSFKDASDISSFKEGDLTWEGYTYTYSGTSSACITAKDGDALWVCTLVLEKGDEKISLDDEDVKSILSSLKAK